MMFLNKKILIAFLAILLAGSLAGCNQIVDTTATLSTTQSTTTTDTTVSQTTTAAPILDLALELELPAKLVYQPGQPADWTGLAVTIVRSDGDRIELPFQSYTITGFDTSVRGLVMVTVAYDDLSAAFPIYVAADVTDGIELTIVPPSKTVYAAGEEFDPSGLVVTFSAEGKTPVTLVSGQYEVLSPDMETVGTYEVFVSTLGLEATFEITINPVQTNTLDLIPYFDDAEGLTGEALVLALREILTSTMDGVTYGDTRYILDETDADPARSGYLVEFYTGQSRNGFWDNGVTWNREHLWPQSKLGVEVDNSYVGVGSDLFNLAPADPGLNSTRGNKWFSTITNAYSYNLTRTSIRGDLARGYLYMTIMYDYLELIELGESQEPALYRFGDLSTLLQWCIDDPVDDFERHRNEVIYSYQHNRNPFVDHPELIELIWGNN